MINQVEGNIMASSSCPDDHSLLSSVLLRGRILVGVDDLSLELFLLVAVNQPSVHEHEENRGE